VGEKKGHCQDARGENGEPCKSWKRGEVKRLKEKRWGGGQDSGGSKRVRKKVGVFPGSNGWEQWWRRTSKKMGRGQGFCCSKKLKRQKWIETNTTFRLGGENRIKVGDGGQTREKLGFVFGTPSRKKGTFAEEGQERTTGLGFR